MGAVPTTAGHNVTLPDPTFLTLDVIDNMYPARHLPSEVGGWAVGVVFEGEEKKEENTSNSPDIEFLFSS